jgi:hypothetical protein
MLDENFDGINWLNMRFQHTNVDFAQLRHVLSFSLLWNLFETKACNRTANPNSIKRSVDAAVLENRLNHEKYLTYVIFFRNRYIDENNNFDNRFNNLGLTNEEHRQIVERTLQSNTNVLNSDVYALLLIAHRIRNNLFHGNKNIQFLESQTDLFKVVNNLLADYIEDITNA